MNTETLNDLTFMIGHLNNARRIGLHILESKQVTQYSKMLISNMCKQIHRFPADVAKNIPDDRRTIGIMQIREFDGAAITNIQATLGDLNNEQLNEVEDFINQLKKKI